MPERVEQQTLQKRFPVFTGLAVIICFVLFPLFLINAAANRVLQIKHDGSLNKTRQELENTLDILESCSDNRHFAHLLLSHAFKSALKNDNPALSLKQNLSGLKNRYPGVFFFVVWDDKGRIIQELTDETSFAYILRETFKLLHDLAENCQRYYPGAPEKIPGLSRRLKMVRHYIGRVISNQWIQRPLQTGKLSSAIIAEPDGAKSHVWYSVDKRISMLAFIHSDFFAGQSGLEFAIKRLQAINPKIKAGYSQFPIEPKNVYQYGSETSPVVIALAISRFDNMHPTSMLHYENRVFSYRYISPTIRAFCHIAENALFPVSHNKRLIMGKTVKWLIVLIFLAFVAVKKYQLSFIPARLKLSALFLYAGGIPVLIIFIIGADYLQQKRTELIYAEQSQGLEILRHIDDGFMDFLAMSAKKISRQLRQQTQNQNALTDRAQIKVMRRQFVAEYQPGSIMLFDSQGRNLVGEEENMPFPDVTVIGQISQEVLEFINHASTEKFELTAIAKPMAVEIIFRAGKISNFSLGDHKTYSFYDYIGQREKYASNGFFYMFWRQEDLQRRYLEQVVRDTPSLSAYFSETDRFLGKNVRPGGQLGRMLQKTESLLVVREAEIMNHGEMQLAAAMRGNNLDKSCLAVTVPFSRIDTRMQAIYINFAVIAILFLFFCTGGILMMRHRLLAPLHQFKEAIEAIGQRNFRYRSGFSGNNEFGKLSRALNHTLENLSELEVARIVQENLLPGREYRQNKLELLASLTQMSHIGGDYYDFFAINQDFSGIFIGDVSGHGISSALFMAMARSAIIFENFAEPEQIHLMQTVNNVIYKMRKSGAKEYMSGLSLFINSNTGEFSVFNAGHCPPIIIRGATGKVEQLLCKGLYFGFKEKYSEEPVNGRLENGDFIALYTDSWVESTSRTGLAFGFGRFEQALLNCRDSNLELFAQSMFATISRWEAERQDDMTLLLAKFGDNHES
ncbi:MAG: SpoIIE family protein phosphatase [Candidatus Riflebacteria bacterium]|nr:SpoIIE family protein phosphatase [Candidatus Riflebacteria bacterium]